MKTKTEQVTWGITESVRSWSLTLIWPTPGSTCNIRVCVLTTLFHPSKPSIRPISHLEEELSFGVIDKKTTPILEEEKLSPDVHKDVLDFCEARGSYQVGNEGRLKGLGGNSHRQEAYKKQGILSSRPGWRGSEGLPKAAGI